MYDDIIKSDNIPIDMSGPSPPQTLVVYIETWRLKLWDMAFTGMFKGADTFKKSDNFKEFKGAMLAVKRVIYS